MALSETLTGATAASIAHTILYMFEALSFYAVADFGAASSTPQVEELRPKRREMHSSAPGHPRAPLSGPPAAVKNPISMRPTNTISSHFTASTPLVSGALKCSPPRRAPGPLTSALAHTHMHVSAL